MLSYFPRSQRIAIVLIQERLRISYVTAQRYPSKGKRSIWPKKLSFICFWYLNCEEASVMQSWICFLSLGKKKLKLCFIRESWWVTFWLYEPSECFELFHSNELSLIILPPVLIFTRKCAHIPARSPLANSLYPQKLVCLPPSDSTEEELQFFFPPFDDFLALVLMFANLG